MIPILYSKEEKTFTSLGLGEIHATKVHATRIRNADYHLYIEYPATGILADVFEKEMQIKSNAGLRTKWQTFDITRVVKADKGIIKIYAQHIANRTLHMSLPPKLGVNNGTAQEALRIWRDNVIGEIEFDYWTDVDTRGSTQWRIDEIENARYALGGKRGSILDVWGGEFEFDNTRIKLHKQMGRTAPTVLEFGRNITSFEQDENIEGVYTSIYPYVRYNNEEGNDVLFALPELVVDGEYMDEYENRRIQLVDFSEHFDTSGENPTYPTNERLRELAQQYVKSNHVGSPKFSQEIKYIDLGTTLNYQEYKFMEEVELNDILPVYYPNMNTERPDVKVTEIIYDVLMDRNYLITISTIGSMTSKTLTQQMVDKLDTLHKSLNQNREAKTPPYSVNSEGKRVWWGEPYENLEHKIGDLAFIKNGQYMIIKEWDGAQWVVQIDSETFEKELQEKIDGALDEIAKMDAEISKTDDKVHDIVKSYEFAPIKDVELSLDLLDQHKQLLDSLETDTSRLYLDMKTNADLIDDQFDLISSLEVDTQQLNSAQIKLENSLNQAVNDLSNTKENLSKTANDLSTTRTELTQTGENALAALNHAETALSNISSLDGQVSGLKLNVDKLNNEFNLSVGKFTDSLAGGSQNLAKGSKGPFTAPSEFLRTVDLAPVIDRYGPDQEFTLTFDIKSADINQRNRMRVYMQNGSTQRYKFSPNDFIHFDVTEDWQTVSLTGVKFRLSDSSVTESYLSFFGNYGTGNIPHVRNIMFSLGSITIPWAPAPEDVEERFIKNELDISINAEALRLKVDKEAHDALSQVVTRHSSDLKATAEELSYKADSEELNQLTGIVKDQSSVISANSRGLSLKADKTTVDALQGLTNQNSADIQANSERFSSLYTKKEVDGIVDDKVNISEYNLFVSQTAEDFRLKADKSELNSLSNSVTQNKADIRTNSERFGSLYTKNEVNDLVDGKLDITTHETFAEQTAEQFKRTATQESLNEATGRIESNRMEIVEQADKVEAELTQIKQNKVDKTVYQSFLNNEYERTAQGMVDRFTAIENNPESNITGFNELKVTAEGNERTIATIQNDLDSKASVAQFNQVRSTVDSNSQNIVSQDGRINSLQQNLNGTQSTVANITDGIGGRNYVTDSGNVDYFKIYRATGSFETVDSEESPSGKVQKIHIEKPDNANAQITYFTLTRMTDDSMKKDRVYTISFEIKSSKDIDFKYNSGNSLSTISNETLRLTSEYQTYSFTVKATEDGVDAGNMNAHFKIDNDYVEDFTITVQPVMVVEGYLPMSWTPAPEDLASVTLVNQVKQTADTNSSTISTLDGNLGDLRQTIDSLQSTIRNSEGNYNQWKQTVDSTVNSIGKNGENISTLLLNDQLFYTQVREPINQAYAKADDAENGIHAINYPNLVKDDRTTKSFGYSHSFDTVPFLLDEGGLTFSAVMSRSSVNPVLRVFFDDGTSAFWTMSTTTTANQQYNRQLLYTGTPKTVVRIEVEGSSDEYLRIDEVQLTHRQPDDVAFLPIRSYATAPATSRIAQLSDSISLKVSKGESVSDINLSPTGVRINSDKVAIGNSTLFTGSGFITNNMIANGISANKITTGSLDANKVNINNLNVNSLNGNRSAFVQTAWNGIDGYVQIRGDGGITLMGYGGWRYSRLEGDGITFIDIHGNQVGYMGRMSPTSQGTLDAGSQIHSSTATHYIGMVGNGDGVDVALGYNDTPHPTRYKRALSVDGSNGDLRIFTPIHSGTNTHTMDLWSGQHRASWGIGWRGTGNARNSRIWFSDGTSYLESAGPMHMHVRSESTPFLEVEQNIDMHKTLNMRGNRITNQSDIRLKENIQDIDFSPLKEIQKSGRLHYYKWKKDHPVNETKPTGKQLGLIAQENPFFSVQESDHSHYENIDQSKLLHVMYGAIQELADKVDELEKELTHET